MQYFACTVGYRKLIWLCFQSIEMVSFDRHALISLDWIPAFSGMTGWCVIQLLETTLPLI